jgi:hypothetical protein
MTTQEKHYHVAKSIAGQHEHEVCSAICDRDQAISELHFKWLSFMHADFLFNVPGEVLEEGDDVNEPVIAGGGHGWYHAERGMDGGRPDFEADDFPESVEEWLARGIDRWSYDNFTYYVAEV